MSGETIQGMERLVDDPFNDMMLEYNIHDHFDKLKVYLTQTVVNLQASILAMPRWLQLQ
jgi:hypothetical protein